MTWLEKRTLEILAVYRKWYAAGLTDKEISLKIRGEFPSVAKPFKTTR